MASAKRILVLGTSARGGDWPPLAAVTVGLHQTGHAVQCFGDPAIAQALRLIREQAHTGLKVDALARAVGLSRSVLQRRFRSVLKHSVHQELLSARIKKARELLTGTELSLAVIAERAGFKHQEYMGAVFKERLEKTPGEMRRG